MSDLDVTKHEHRHLDVVLIEDGGHFIGAIPKPPAGRAWTDGNATFQYEQFAVCTASSTSHVETVGAFAIRSGGYRFPDMADVPPPFREFLPGRRPLPAFRDRGGAN